MSQRALSGPHLVLRFHEHDKRGQQEIHGLAFALDFGQLKVIDEFGGWQSLLRFDYNDHRWHRVGNGSRAAASVSALKLEHSDGEELTLALHCDLSNLSEVAGKSANELDFRGIVLFERPPSKRSVLTVKLQEEPASGDTGKRPKTNLAYQELGSFRWRALQGGLGGIHNAAGGTLSFRTPGRGLVPEVRIRPGRASRPTGLAEGLCRAA
jgi:hypothetical protein